MSNKQFEEAAGQESGGRRNREQQESTSTETTRRAGRSRSQTGHATLVSQDRLAHFWHHHSAGFHRLFADAGTRSDAGGLRELAVGVVLRRCAASPRVSDWTIYTWLFTEFLPISNIAFRVAVSSAVAGALGCGLLALMVLRGSSMMIEGIAELKTIERRWEKRALRGGGPRRWNAPWI